MKVKITENTKKAFFISEMPCLKIAEDNLKEWGGISKEDIQGLGNFICGIYGSKIMEAEAEFGKNSRVWDKYGEGTADFASSAIAVLCQEK